MSFPKLDKGTIFVAAPGDVAYIRDIAVQEAERVRLRLSDPGAVSVFDWTIDLSEIGFDDQRPAQAQIPLPSDPNCKAVVCIFGERIGTPLPADFPIGAVEHHMRPEGYGLRVPWIPSEVDAGGFSLTGSVFEYLAAVPDGPPVLLIFVGDKAAPGTEEVLDAGWGLGRLLRAKEKELSRSALRKWEADVYEPQLKQLRNFVRYINTRGIFPRFVDDEAEIAGLVSVFLTKTLGLQADKNAPKAFKDLKSYDMEDHNVFFGREEERKAALEQLRAAWEHPSQPRSLCIAGASGSGKSSLMKAGLLGHLNGHTRHGHHVCVVLNAADWMQQASDSAAPLLVLENITSAVLDSLATEQVEPVLKQIRTSRPDAVASIAHEAIRSALSLRPDGARLILGLDQFEAFVDTWMAGGARDEWSVVANLLLKLANDDNSALAYTLQVNRLESLVSDPTLGKLWASEQTLLLSFPFQSLRSIVEKPFAADGIALEADLSAQIVKIVERISAETSHATTSSLMPVLSLALSRIRENCVAHDGKLTLADCEGYLDFGQIIDQRGGAALNSASEAIADRARATKALETLFRKLVSISRLDGEFLTLNTAIPGKSPDEKHLVDALVAQRFVTRTPDGRIAFSHEVILRLWSEARSWLATEIDALRDREVLLSDARQWAHLGRPSSFCDDAGAREVARAETFLYKWFFVVGPYNSESAGADDMLAREYSLALLLAHPDPRKTQSYPDGPCSQAELAALYSDTNLLSSYLAIDPTLVTFRNSFGRTLLSVVSRNSDIDAVRLLLDKGSEIDAATTTGTRAIHNAVRWGSLDIVDLLLSRGAQPDLQAEGGRTPLSYAVQYQRPDIVERILADASVNPHAMHDDKWTPYLWAIEMRNASIVRAIATHPRFKVNSVEGESFAPVIVAVHNYNAEVFRLLIEIGEDIHAKMNDGRRAIDIALQRRNFELVGILSQLDGVDLNGRDRFGRTALHRAATRPFSIKGKAMEFEDDALVDYLLDNGVDVESTCNQGLTPLHHAAAAGHISLVTKLLNAKCLVDPQSPDGLTPLHLAVDRAKHDVIALLRAAGANAHSHDRSQCSPLDAARASGDSALVTLLEAAPAI